MKSRRKFVGFWLVQRWENSRLLKCIRGKESKGLCFLKRGLTPWVFWGVAVTGGLRWREFYQFLGLILVLKNNWGKRTNKLLCLICFYYCYLFITCVVMAQGDWVVGFCLRKLHWYAVWCFDASAASKRRWIFGPVQGVFWIFVLFQGEFLSFDPG